MSKSAARDSGKKKAVSPPETSRGNRRLSRDSASRDAAAREATPGSAWHVLATRVQTKLTVGPANDVYEQEADRVADRVLRMSLPPSGGAAGMLDDQLLAQPISLVQRRCAACRAEELAQPKLAGVTYAQRKCAACAAEEEEQPGGGQRVMRAAESSPAASPSHSVDASIGRLRQGGGQPLPGSVRSFMEPRFGRDFSGVRVHTGAEPGAAARGLNARAFTIGRDIMFGAGEFQPETRSGQHLLAHELTHVVQQGAAGQVAQRTPRGRASLPSPSTSSVRNPGPMQHSPDVGPLQRTGEPRIQRLDWPSVDDVLEFGGDVIDTGVSAGRAVGSAIGDAAGAVAGIATEVWDQARALARVLGGIVSVSGTRLVINVPSLPVCPTIPLQFTLPHLGAYLPLAMGPIPVSKTVSLLGTVGVTAGATPEMGVQLGPCQLIGLRIVIDPLGGDFTAAGGVRVHLAASLGAEANVGVRGVVLGLLAGHIGPPMLLPPVAIEAGLAGLVRGISSTTVEVAGVLNVSSWSFSYHAASDFTLGLGADLALAGYGSADILGVNLCRFYWPFLAHHGQVTLTAGYDVRLVIDTSGVEFDFNLHPPRLDEVPFEDLPVELSRQLLSDDCPICPVLDALGLPLHRRLPGAWSNGPRSDVYPRQPADRSAQCRGACGPDCDTCGAARDEVDCVDTGDGRHQLWVYPNLTTCPTHQGCVAHDACYDWCDMVGENILGPCHRICDIECVCDYNGPDCLNWIFGEGGDAPMRFSDEPRIIGGCRGACPEEQPDDGSTWRVCLPRIEFLNPRSIRSEPLELSTGEIPIFSIDIEAPPPVFWVQLEIYGEGQLEGGIAATLRQPALTNLCFDVDPRTGRYTGTARLEIPAELTGNLVVRGTLTADADWFRIINVARARGGLEAHGDARLRQTLEAAATVTCENGEPQLALEVGLPGDLEVVFRLDATFEIALVSYNLLSRRWKLLERRWNHQWGSRVGVGATTGGRTPDVDLSGETINVEDLLGWLFESIDEDGDGGDGGGPGALPPGSAVPTGLTSNDPIDIRWYKPASAYPASVTLAEQEAGACATSADCSSPTPDCTPLFIGSSWRSRCTRNRGYSRNVPSNLPALTGRQSDTTVGVSYYPGAGDVVVLDPTPRSGSAQAGFNRRFARHGYRLQDHSEEPDHVLDLDWNGADDFSNLWPLDATLNQAAGREQNLNQRVTFAESAGGQVHTNMTLRTFKQQGFHRRNPPHRFFRIALVGQP